jgi:hypothetical protein
MFDPGMLAPAAVELSMIVPLAPLVTASPAVAAVGVLLTLKL